MATSFTMRPPGLEFPLQVGAHEEHATDVGRLDGGQVAAMHEVAEQPDRQAVFVRGLFDREKFAVGRVNASNEPVVIGVSAVFEASSEAGS